MPFRVQGQASDQFCIIEVGMLDIEKKKYKKECEHIGSKRCCSCLCVRIEHGEVTDDNGNRKCDSEYTGESTQATDQHSWKSLWCHIAISYGRHGNKCPPKSTRYTVKVVFRVLLKQEHAPLKLNIIVSPKLYLELYPHTHTPSRSRALSIPEYP